jgi:hypothetical protein
MGSWPVSRPRFRLTGHRFSSRYVAHGEEGDDEIAIVSKRAAWDTPPETIGLFEVRQAFGQPPHVLLNKSKVVTSDRSEMRETSRIRLQY